MKLNQGEYWCFFFSQKVRKKALELMDRQIGLGCCDFTGIWICPNCIPWICTVFYVHRTQSCLRDGKTPSLCQPSFITTYTESRAISVIAMSPHWTLMKFPSQPMRACVGRRLLFCSRTWQKFNLWPTKCSYIPFLLQKSKGDAAYGLQIYQQAKSISQAHSSL